MVIYFKTFPSTIVTFTEKWPFDITMRETYKEELQ